MANPTIPNPPYHGGCLCGAVRYTLNARPMALNACHCADCQKMTGATNLLMIMGPNDAFTHDGGETHSWIRRADSGREIDIKRCAVCGTRVWQHPLSAPQYVFIAAGTLDDASWVVPTSHIWIEKAAPSAFIPPGVWTHVGQPADRAGMMDAFAKAYPT